jgi:hypothetical protein
MLKFLFWNIARNPVTPLIADLAIEREVDFILLAECAIPPARLLLALNAGSPQYHYVPNQYERLVLFVRFSSELTRTLLDSPNLLITRVSLPAREEFLLAAVHLPSRLREEATSLNMEGEEIARTIREHETREGHERTLVIGDFNLNPFEPAVAGTAGFHAVMSKQIARRGARVVHGRRYPFFYNPLWNHFGDETPPAGTYFYRGGGHLAYFWHIFDQVLVRPELIKYLPAQPVEIITTVKAQTLLRGNEVPDRTRMSDHLPVLFTMKM